MDRILTRGVNGSYFDLILYSISRAYDWLNAIYIIMFFNTVFWLDYLLEWLREIDELKKGIWNHANDNMA